MTHLIALRSKLPYGGKCYRSGQPFCALDEHARLLVAIGVARVESVEERNFRNTYPAGKPESDPAGRPRRRTLTAQVPAAHAEETA